MTQEEPKFGMPGGGDKQKRDRKILNPQAKELILNVVNFMKREANGDFIIPPKKVQCRAAAATGFSERTVRRIVKESKSINVENGGGEGGSIVFPPKKVPSRRKPKTGLDELTRATIRKMIHSIYVNDKTVPSIKKIHQKLVQELGFKGSSRSTHKIIKELGFFWKKTKCKTYVLIEKHDIRLKRIEYLRSVMRYRSEGRYIIYVGDTCVTNQSKVKTQGERIVLIHAGGESGFLPNALAVLSTAKVEGDYHQDLSNEFHLWVKNTLIPVLPSQAVVVLDNTIYQNIQTESIPTLDCNAEQMKLWLHSKNISFNEDMLRPELHQIIKKHSTKFRKQKGIVEQMLTEMGHSILPLPPCHPDLNPLDLIWTDVRQYVTERISTFDVKTVKLVCQERLHEIGPQVWLLRCDQVKNVEQQYLESEGIIDREIEKMMAKLPLNRDLKGIQEEQDETDEHDINFVKHFMGGLLGLENYKMPNG